MFSGVLFVLIYIGVSLSEEIYNKNQDSYDKMTDCRALCGETYFKCMLLDCQKEDTSCDIDCTSSFRRCYDGCEVFLITKPITSLVDDYDPFKLPDR